MRIRLDKVASSTRNAKLSQEVRLSPDIIAQEGYVIAAKVLARKEKYNELEDIHGRMVKIIEGDLVAGVLGARKALRGYSGYVPSEIHVGDHLSLLNLGGVIGKCESFTGELGSPIPVEVLGAILSFPSIDDRIGIQANIMRGSVEWADKIGPCPPVIYVSGTCMNTGKTTACAEIIREMSHRGYRVAGAKLTGVSLLRDTLQMEDCGAIKSLNFTDAGAASTAADKVIPIAKGILNGLQAWEPNVIVVELGDGLAGEYGVAKILADPELMSVGVAHVVCASDPIAAWGATRYFQEEFSREITLMSGPVTDNDVGTHFVQETLHLPAWNARRDHRKLVDYLETYMRKNAAA